MDWLFEPLAASNLLVAIANVVALSTAAYFGYKAIRWIIKFLWSLYHNKVRDFLRKERQFNHMIAVKCSKDPSFFIAHVIGRAVIITNVIIVVIIGTALLNSHILAIRSRSDIIIEGMPLWIPGEASYNLISIGTVFLCVVGIIYLNGIHNLSIRVRRILNEATSGDPE